MSKEFEFEFKNYANIVNKDLTNLMELLKKQSKDNKPILYLGKTETKVILPYEEYKKMNSRLDAIDNANPSEVLECLDKLEECAYGMKDLPMSNWIDLAKSDAELDLKIMEWVETIKFELFKGKQALLKQQEPNSTNLLMRELDCKDFTELKKYARCGYEKLNKKYLKWEDLEFKTEEQTMKVILNGNGYTLKYCKLKDYDVDRIRLVDENLYTYLMLHTSTRQIFNDLHLERVE